MLQEVCGSVAGIGLGSASGIDENTDGSGLRVGRVLGSDLSRHQRLYPPVIHPAVIRTVRPFLRVVLWVVVWAAAGVANDRVKLGNFLGRAFRRNEADNVLRATRAAAIVTAVMVRGEEDGEVVGCDFLVVPGK